MGTIKIENPIVEEKIVKVPVEVEVEKIVDRPITKIVYRDVIKEKIVKIPVSPKGYGISVLINIALCVVILSLLL